MNKNSLLIAFPDKSKSFTYGVEYGRLLEKMQRSDNCISNNGFPIRIENKELIKNTCNCLGYIPQFGEVYFSEWIEFLGVKKVALDN